MIINLNHSPEEVEVCGSLKAGTVQTAEQKPLPHSVSQQKAKFEFSVWERFNFHQRGAAPERMKENIFL